MMVHREIKREYLAICHGTGLPKTGIVDAPIARVEGSTIERCVDFEHGEHAVTHFCKLKEWKDMTLLSLWLETGRTHQIRVHMKHLGHPLIGDFLYFPHSEHNIKRQALHAYRLTFLHPITNEPMVLTAPIPEDMKNCFDFSEVDI
jgi:23S rRNA pseudouridine1911/1915/1917 synthase